MPVVLSDGNANLVATVSFLIIDSMILFLRLVSKRKTQSGVHLDDWFILAAYLVFAAQSSVIIYDVVAIAGTLDPGLILRPSNQLRMLKFLWIGSLHYPLVITMVKLSILSFYLSMFTVEKSFRIAAWAAICLCVIWGIGTMYLTAFGCKPIIAAYDLTLRLKPTTRCFPYGLLVLVFESSNVLIDAFILILPIFIIHILHLPLRKKLLLVLVFWTGGFVMITCILRIVYSFDLKDIYDFSSFSLANEWLMIEEGSAIAAACLPTFRPLVTACFKFTDAFTERFTSTRSSPRSHGLAESGFSNGHLHNAGHYARFDEDHREQAPDSEAWDTAGGRWQLRRESIPLNNIHV